MDDHRVEADVLQKDDVRRKRLAQLLVLHGGAAVLDDDGAPVKLPDVGKGLEECLYGSIHGLTRHARTREQN
jgi:hypothetical protein